MIINLQLLLHDSKLLNWKANLIIWLISSEEGDLRGNRYLRKWNVTPAQKETGLLPVKLKETLSPSLTLPYVTSHKMVSSSRKKGQELEESHQLSKYLSALYVRATNTGDQKCAVLTSLFCESCFLWQETISKLYCSSDFITDSFLTGTLELSHDEFPVSVAS